MGEQYLIVSLPSSGSDWLADAVAKANPQLKYFRKEFFNPILNMRHEAKLERAFGCELVSCYRNIAEPCEARTDALYQAYSSTWPESGFNFDKEVFAFFKIGFFAPRFRMTALYRSFTQTFPPKRLRVLQWYEAIFLSIVENEGKLDERLRDMTRFARKHADTLPKRAAAAHAMGYTKLFEDCERYEVPVIDYTDLTGDVSFVEAALRPGLPAGLDAKRTASELVASRRLEARSTEHPWQWEGVQTFYDALARVGEMDHKLADRRPQHSAMAGAGRAVALSD